MQSTKSHTPMTVPERLAMRPIRPRMQFDHHEFPRPSARPGSCRSKDDGSRGHALRHPQRLHRCRHRIRKEHRINPFYDVPRDFEEVAFVLQGDQRLSSAIVHGNLQWFGQPAPIDHLRLSTSRKRHHVLGDGATCDIVRVGVRLWAHHRSWFDL